MRRHLRGGSVRLKHLNASGRFPSGNTRFYYRPKGQKGVALPDLPPDHPDFLKAYAQASGEKPKASKPGAGTLAEAITTYKGDSAFKKLSPGTRAQRARMLDDMARRYGAASFAGITAKNVRLDLSRLDPHPANNRLKAWRGLFKWAVVKGRLDSNPVTDVAPHEIPHSDGFISWEREDFETFRAFWPLDSRQRLAFELMYLSCASIGDAVRLGPGMVRNGWMIYERSKSRSMATFPVTAPAPVWSEPDHLFLAAIEAQPIGETYIITAAGKPRSHKAAASWFSEACTKAGMPHLSAHGIRKGRAAMFKENGAAPEQRMAWMGHETESEARGYSKAADLRRTIEGMGSR